MSDNKLYYEIDEALEALGKQGLDISNTSLINKIKSGSIKAYRPAKKYLIPIEEIENFVTKHPVTPISKNGTDN